MLVHGDFSFSDLCELTRQRRRERRLASQAEHSTLRYSVEPDAVVVEFVPVIPVVTATGRRKSAAQAWRKRQWKAGNRRCYYCEIVLVKPESPRVASTPNMATVDHKHPLALGGDDASWNWAVCCWLCNNRKGAMTEAEFRGLLASEASGGPSRSPPEAIRTG